MKRAMRWLLVVIFCVTHSIFACSSNARAATCEAPSAGRHSLLYGLDPGRAGGAGCDAGQVSSREALASGKIRARRGRPEKEDGPRCGAAGQVAGHHLQCDQKADKRRQREQKTPARAVHLRSAAQGSTAARRPCPRGPSSWHPSTLRPTSTAGEQHLTHHKMLLTKYKAAAFMQHGNPPSAIGI